MTAKPNIASSTDVSRKFGDYARAALTDPVMIAQHGQVRLVLVNSEIFQELNRRLANDTGRLRAKLDIVLDTIGTLVVLVDHEARVTTINAASRRYFGLGSKEVAGIPVATLLEGPHIHSLETVVQRVLATGASEDYFVESVRYAGRTLHTRILPFPGGAGIFVEDVTDSLASARAEATNSALATALGVAAIGRGRINIRGAIEDVSDALVDISGASHDRLLNSRLASLFAVAHRDAVSTLVEQALREGQPGAVIADLLTDAGSLTVRLGLAPIDDRETGLRAAFVIAPLALLDPRRGQ